MRVSVKHTFGGPVDFLDGVSFILKRHCGALSMLGVRVKSGVTDGRMKFDHDVEGTGREAVSARVGITSCLINDLVFDHMIDTL
jgi:hypothetical protein